MGNNETARHVHLVGSIGLDTVDDVFNAAGKILGKRLRRVPDGEVGGRRLWISWQAPVFRANAHLVLEQPGQGVFGKMKLAEGSTAADVHFGELGYAREARASYLDFKAARERGTLPANVRMQVSLPAPLEVLWPLMGPSTTQDVEPAYEAAMLAELERLCAAIPHEDLAIQWDICIEMCIWDGQSPVFTWKLPGDGRTEIIKRIKRLAERVPSDVELGFHLCYGDLDAKHFFDPKDLGPAVDMANHMLDAISRPVQWIHMPVPVARDDEEFFKPLANLRLKPETELFLGCVHLKDGADGTKRRIAAAARVIDKFGVATECGFGRARTKEMAQAIMQVHADSVPEPS